jgi:predicted dinucleotide-binding enzyme
MKTIGLIGAGHIGSQVARLAVGSGYDVLISNSRGPETLSDLVAELGSKARAATPLEAAKAGDIVVVTIPLKNYRSVPVEPLAGKIVIDTNNYYPQRDGHIAVLDNETTTTSELLQAHLPASKVVKAFNHIHAAQLTTDGRPPGTKNRRALVIAGDDREIARPRRSSRVCSISSASTPSMPVRSVKGGASSVILPATDHVARRRSCVKTSLPRNGMPTADEVCVGEFPDQRGSGDQLSENMTSE